MTPAMASVMQAAASSEIISQWVIPCGRPTAVVHFEEGIVEFFIDAAGLLGVPKSIAAVYGIVFASPLPLSFSEIRARLRFSGGSVSTALKVLREVGAIRLAAADANVVRSSIRDRFEPDTEMRRLIERFIESRVETQLSRGKARLATLEANMATYGEAEAKVLVQRLNKLRRWHDRTRALMPVIRTFLNLTKL